MATSNQKDDARTQDAMDTSKQKRQMRVLCLGLFRTGTYSMYTALTTLGFENVYHGLNSLGANDDWAILSAAADATFSTLPTYRGDDKPFTRDEWDALWGSCEAVTDVASVFGPALIKAYPEAKVVLWERDFEKWYKSVTETVVDSLFGTVGSFFVGTVEPFIGSVAGLANRKMLLGWARAADGRELRDRETLRRARERHHKEIRDMCASQEGKMLDFKMADGWEPLCEFLGCEVPRGEDGQVLPFPRANEAAALRQKIQEQQLVILKKAARTMLPWVGAVGVVGAGWWWATRGSF